MVLNYEKPGMVSTAFVALYWVIRQVCISYPHRDAILPDGLTERRYESDSGEWADDRAR